MYFEIDNSFQVYRIIVMRKMYEFYFAHMDTKKLLEFKKYWMYMWYWFFRKFLHHPNIFVEKCKQKHYDRVSTMHSLIEKYTFNELNSVF